MKEGHYPVIIIGGGASGLFASHLLKFSLLIEKGPVCGRKLLMSGGGKCNLTHAEEMSTLVRRYYDKRSFVSAALQAFPPTRIMEHFDSLGVPCMKREDGKVFPRSERAADVRDALLHGQGRILTGTEVLKASKCGELFEVETTRGTFTSNGLILATGGRYTPQTGSDGSGYALAAQFGHTIVPVHPALSPLMILGRDVSMLEGLTIEDVRISVEGKRAEGPLLFTRRGISGPMVLNLSRSIIGRGEITMRFREIDGGDIKALDGKLMAPGAIHRLTGLPSRFTDTFIPKKQIASLTKAEMQGIVSALTSFKAMVKCDEQSAMVSAGGISTAEVDRTSFESKRCKGLYIIGEALDVDGECGGYNLTFAWASARLAALHILSSQAS